MADATLLLAGLLCSIVGFAWLALAMDVHWQQVLGATPCSNGTRVLLRVLGGVAVTASLLLALAVDHASIAALVWVMSLAAAALIVAFMLAWRPALLSIAAPWIRATSS